MRSRMPQTSQRFANTATTAIDFQLNSVTLEHTMNTTIRKGMFVKVNVPVIRYADKAMPADTVYIVSKASRKNPGQISIYGKDLCYSRTVNAADCTVVDGPKVTVNVGDYFAASWGYDQTNIDFFKITRIVGKSAILASVPGIRKYDGPMHGHVKPDVDAPVQGERKHLIKITSEGTPYFKLSSYMFAYPCRADSNCFFSEWA